MVEPGLLIDSIASTMAVGPALHRALAAAIQAGIEAHGSYRIGKQAGLFVATGPP